MTYRVVYTTQFRQALLAQLDYFEAQKAPQSRISAWLADLLALIDGLHELPNRHSVAEIESTNSGVELRKLVFGNYLAFYHADKKRREVQILGVRHGARLPW